MILVELDKSALVAASREYRDALLLRSLRALHEQAEATRERLVSGIYWKNRKGRLAKSFKVVDQADAQRAEVRSGSQVAKFLDQGTKAHPIQPKLGAGFVGPAQLGQGRRSRGEGRHAVRFVAGGATLFRSAVKHPGTKAVHFMTKESRIAEPLTHAALERAATDAAGDADLR